MQSDMTTSSDITVEEARLALQAEFISKEDALDQSQSVIEFISRKLSEAKHKKQKPRRHRAQMRKRENELAKRKAVQDASAAKENH